MCSISKSLEMRSSYAILVTQYDQSDIELFNKPLDFSSHCRLEGSALLVLLYHLSFDDMLVG